MESDQTDALYERWIEPMEDRMVLSIGRILRDPEEASEAMQAAVVKILKKVDAIAMHPNPQALILRICIDESLTRLRRQHRDRLTFLQAIDASVPDEKPGPDQVVQFREMESEVYETISQLPLLQGQAVYQRLILDLDYKEISVALGCSEEAVRQHVARGRKKLMTALSHWFEPSTNPKT